MSATTEQFLFPAEQWPDWRDFAFRRSVKRLEGIPSTSHRYLFFWARNALYHGLGALGIKPGDAVLVPAYVCTAAVEAVEAFGAKVVYYEVKRDCLPDFSDLEAKIDGQTRAILAVHYFGFPCGIRQMRKICDERELCLLEDCAHVLQGEEGGQPLGTFGDASVFSWRKFLPLYDGGELVLNRWQRALNVPWRKEGFLFTLRVAKNLIERALPEPLAKTLGRLRMRQPSASEGETTAESGGSSKPHQVLKIHSNSASFDQQMINFPISRVSRILLEHTSIKNIIERRRANYSYLQAKLAEMAYVKPLFESLPPGVCPWVYPVFFKDLPNSHFLLRKLGVPAVSWGGVRHPGIRPEEFPTADFLYENLIFLPLHQGLRSCDLDLIVEALGTVHQRGPEMDRQPF